MSEDPSSGLGELGKEVPGDVVAEAKTRESSVVGAGVHQLAYQVGHGSRDDVGLGVAILQQKTMMREERRREEEKRETINEKEAAAAISASIDKTN